MKITASKDSDCTCYHKKMGRNHHPLPAKPQGHQKPQGYPIGREKRLFQVVTRFQMSHPSRGGVCGGRGGGAIGETTASCCYALRAQFNHFNASQKKTR